jgi:uncharacterized protein (DUF433 family)
MTQYALNLPTGLKSDAERLAKEQGVSLDQFILWSLAEKVGGLLQTQDDPRFSNIIYRRGASGSLAPVIRGRGLRVQTLVIASSEFSPAQLAEEYDLPESHVQEALEFYKAHRAEIDAYIEAEAALEPPEKPARD